MDDLVVSLVTKYPVVATVVAGLIAAHALAVFIVNLTPTPADDEFVGKAYKFLEYVAGVISGRAKQLPGEEAEGVAYKTGMYLRPEDDRYDEPNA